MKYKKIIYFITSAVMGLTLGLTVLADDSIPANLKEMAKELGCNTKEDCRKAFDANFNHGLALANKYKVYENNPEQKKLAESFQKEVLTKLSAVRPEELEQKIVELAGTILKNKPDLAKQLGVADKDVKAAEVIVKETKDAGVSLSICSQSADTLSREELIGCLEASKNLVNNKIAAPIISGDHAQKNQNANGAIDLQDALSRGEYSALGNTTDEVGANCLKPDSPQVCQEIAKKFFGPQGVADLERARKEVREKNQDFRPEKVQQPIEKTFEKPKAVCPAMPTVDSCPDGQQKIISYSSPECGVYYSCAQSKAEEHVDQIVDFGNKNWVKTTWKFSDGTTESSYIFNRTDSDYQSYLESVRADCSNIPRSKFSWNYGAGNDSADNWKNFGIPNCKPDGSDNKYKSVCPAYSVTQCPDGFSHGSPVIGSNGCSLPGPCVPIEKPKPITCADNQYWDGNACVNSVAVDPSAGCVKVGGTWDVVANYCRMPGMTASSSMNMTGSANSIGSNHTWKFSDGSTNSSILGRTDAEYTAYISKIDAQCLNIKQSSFQWKSGAGNNSADNWQNFGIPDCSGSATSQSSAVTSTAASPVASSSESTSTPSTATSSADRQCAQSGGTWYSSYNYCEMPSCPSGKTWYVPTNGTAPFCKTNGSTETTAGISGGGTSGSVSSGSSSGGSSSGSGSGYYGGGGDACSRAGGTWNSSTMYCQMPSGGASTASMISGCTSAGGTWDTAANYCRMPGSNSCTSGQYWNGTLCATSSSGSGSGTMMDPATGCAYVHGTWDSVAKYCKMPSSFKFPLSSMLGQFYLAVKGLFK